MRLRGRRTFAQRGPACEGPLLSDKREFVFERASLCGSHEVPLFLVELDRTGTGPNGFVVTARGLEHLAEISTRFRLSVRSVALLRESRTLSRQTLGIVERTVAGEYLGSNRPPLDVGVEIITCGVLLCDT